MRSVFRILCAGVLFVLLGLGLGCAAGSSGSPNAQDTAPVSLPDPDVPNQGPV